MSTDAILGIIRHLLTLAAGYLVHKGVISGDIVDTVVSGLIGMGGIAWSIVQKIETAKQLTVAQPRAATPSPAAQAASTPVSAPSMGSPPMGPSLQPAKPAQGWFTALAAGALWTLLSIQPVLADGLPRTYQPPVGQPTVTVPTFGAAAYFSAIGAYNWTGDIFSQIEERDFSSGQWRLGLGVGLLGKVDKLGLGLDLDAMRQVSGTTFENEWDNWNVTARARAGWFLTNQIMPFVTAGYAHAWGENTFVYGAGLEYFTSDRISFKTELLRYSFDSNINDLRVSVNFKF